jgi:hypothetical protein
MVTKHIMNKTEQYAQDVLETMLEQSYVEEDPVTGEEEQLWLGKLTAFVNELHPKAHPGHVMNILKASDAITILQSGAGGRPSLCRINRPKIFENPDGSPHTFNLPGYMGVGSQQNAQLAVLNKRVLALETTQAQIAEWINNFTRNEQNRAFADQAMEAYGPPEGEAATTQQSEPVQTLAEKLARFKEDVNSGEWQ